MHHAYKSLAVPMLQLLANLLKVNNYYGNKSFERVMRTVLWENFGTFSMVNRCPKTFALGVYVSTALPAVGSRVPHAEAGVILCNVVYLTT